MDKRFILFMVLAVTVLAANQIVISVFFPPEPPAKVAKKDAGKKVVAKDAKADVPDVGAAKADQPADKAADDKPDAAADVPAEDPPEPDDDAKDAQAAPAEPLVKSQRLAIGSGDPGSQYRMSVYLTNDGAAIERLEMNSPLYRDLDNRSGYLGYVAPIDAPQATGALVRVVGDGTPAAKAGLAPGDVITGIGAEPVSGAAALIAALDKTSPDQTIELAVLRDGEEQKFSATLGWQPLAVIRPEHDSRAVQIVEPNNHDPLSFLMTIDQFDNQSLEDGDVELKNVDLVHGRWEVVASNETLAQFRKNIPALGLEVTKTYRLQKVPADQTHDKDYPAYSLLLDVAIANTGDAPHAVAYRLDGPTGLPTEGYWYAIKVSRNWGAAGLRDVVARFEGGATTQVSTASIADEDFDTLWTKTPLDFIAVDAQYFSVALIPQKESAGDLWFNQVQPIRVGAVPAESGLVKLTNVSFRCKSKVVSLEPNGEPVEHHFQVFAGPKLPSLLAEYPTSNPAITLRELVYYGWFSFVAKPMLALLHVFHSLVGNYGIAIIMLTVMVRSCMFPLSRKQALSAQKMQELQPEIKRINEKYKNDAEKKMRAQQQLFRDHNYHPLGGCLLAFVQLPIFVGLYRSLSVDVSLRQAPLLSENIRWASNLAAPDMFYDWSAMMPQFITQGTGFFGLGPYLNILPLVTIVLFIWQQKMFMPPPADEQAAMQQKMMQYMMIFMGFLFFKVASGLCVYFIASSLWGIAERKLLPKTKPADGQPGAAKTVPTASAKVSGKASGNGAPTKKKRQKGRK